MKTKILTIIMFAATLGCFAYNEKDAPASPPTHVINALNNLRELYADKDRIVYRRTVNPDDKSFISSVEIIPFKCPKGQGILTNIKAAFMEDRECAYRFLQVMPGELGAWIVGTGDYKGQEMRTRDQTPQEYIAMYVKNAQDPEKRDYYGVVWDYTSDVIKGKIILITSRRDDLQKESSKTKSQQKQDDLWKKWDKENNKNSINVSRFPANLTPKGNSKIEKQLQAYKDLLEMQEEEIQKLRRDYDRDDLKPEERTLIKQRILKLHKQAQRTTDKIGKLISKVR